MNHKYYIFEIHLVYLKVILKRILRIFLFLLLYSTSPVKHITFNHQKIISSLSNNDFLFLLLFSSSFSFRFPQSPLLRLALARVFLERPKGRVHGAQPISFCTPSRHFQRPTRIIPFAIVSRMDVHTNGSGNGCDSGGSAGSNCDGGRLFSSPILPLPPLR